MGLIVPDAIEHYLAGLNSAGDAVLDEIARGNETRGLPPNHQALMFLQEDIPGSGSAVRCRRAACC